MVSMLSCQFGGCGRSHYARGWCKPHYMQDYRGEEIQEIQPRPGPRLLPQRSCTICGRTVRAKGLCGSHYQTALLKGG